MQDHFRQGVASTCQKSNRERRNRSDWEITLISGGQSGVDRAALDAAIDLGVKNGGWCPRGRRAEDGPLPARYPCRETPDEGYRQRTEWNVRDSDGTLIIFFDTLSGGAEYTSKIADRLNKPKLLIDVRDRCVTADLVTWIKDNRIRTLNIAGPRESGCPGIYAKAYQVVYHLLERLGSMPST